MPTPDNSKLFGELGLPQIAQIGFAVRDLEAAIAFYEPLFGPFKRAPRSSPGRRHRIKVRRAAPTSSRSLSAIPAMSKSN